MSPRISNESNTVASHRRATRDRGFSLVELVVTVAAMGLVSVSLSLIVSVVLRTSPAAEGRDDDARTLLGLTTYMPEDVNSTPGGAANFDTVKTTASGCAGTSPGINLLRLTWEEDTGSSTTFYAAYRYVDDGGGYKIWRYACEAGGTPTVNKMSAVLPPIDETTWVSGTAPVAIVPWYDVNGAYRGVSVQISTPSGDSLDFEMRSNNLEEYLGPYTGNGLLPVPPGNGPPQITGANPLTLTTPYVTMIPFGLPVSDPDQDGLTVTIGPFPNSNWVHGLSGLDGFIIPAPNAHVGNVYNIPYTASDPYGESVSGIIELTIGVAPPNTAPNVTNIVTTVVAGTDTIIDLNDGPRAWDDEGNPMTVNVSGVPAGLTVTVDEMKIIVLADGSVTNPGPFTYTVEDLFGATSAPATVDVTVTSCSVTGLTPSATSVPLKNNGRLKNSVTYTVTYTGPCTDLVLEYNNNPELRGDPGYSPYFLSFGAGSSVTIQGHPGGLNWANGLHEMYLRDGQAGPDLIALTLDVT